MSPRNIRDVSRRCIVVLLVLPCFAAAGVAHADIDAARHALLENKTADAIAQYRTLATAGNPAAQVELATLMMNGIGVPLDRAAALDLFKLAASNGNPEGEVGLASWYMYGQSDVRRYPNAVATYRKYAERGLPVAQTGLGVLYMRGLGVPRDDVEAVHWLGLAADKDASATFILGSIYQTGQGVQRDAAKALEYFEKAQSLGSALAENSIGAIYETGGPGVKIDYARAVLHFRKAAAANIPQAFTNLGRWYDGAPFVMTMAGHQRGVLTNGEMAV